MNILKKKELDDYFTEKEDGTFDVTVHTGRMIEAFVILASIKGDIVTFITETFLCADSKNYTFIKNLLDSINGICKKGSFFINMENKISFKIRIKLDEMEKLENPCDAVFYGCETFEKYQESILKALTGQHIFCWKMVH